MLLNFHYDPYAGGLRPLKEPAGQVVKRAQETDMFGNVIGVIEAKNLDFRTTDMRPVGLWTGEWL